MILRSLLSCVMLALLTTASLAGGESPTSPVLTFADFNQKVLAYYPKLKAAHQDVEGALARQMQARAGFWPSLNLSAGYAVTDDPVNVFGTLLRQKRFTAADFDLKRLNTPARHQDISAGVHFEWPLFDAMQTIGRARSAREGVKAAEADAAFTRMEASLMAQDAYLNALVLERLSAIIDEVQKDSDQDLQKAKELKDKGMILGADYYSARVMLGDFTRLQNEIARQKRAMTALLNILMGEPLDRPWALPGMVKGPDPAGQDTQDLLETALANRPDVQALLARIKAADSELSRERATLLPRLSAFGSAYNDREKLSSSGGTNYSLGLKAEMPLFDRSRESRAQEARARKGQLEQSVQLLRDFIRRDITEELARHDAIRDNLPVLKGMVEDANEAVSLMLPLYNEGRKSIADLLEIRRAYLNSAQAYTKALMGVWLSEARLLFLSGKLDEEAIKKFAEGAGL